MNKKSQAALEFLMTYGWAILVVLVVIGALAYFGVMNPTILLPEKCALQMGMYCKNHLINGRANAVYLNLENGMGKGVIITEINVTDTSNQGIFENCFINRSYRPLSNVLNDKTGWYLQSGKDGDVSVHCDDILLLVGKTKAKLTLRWHFADAIEVFTHTMEGEILAMIESYGDEMCCCDYVSVGGGANAWRVSANCPVAVGCTTDTFFTCNQQQSMCCSHSNENFWFVNAGNCTGVGGAAVSDDQCI